MYSIYQLSIPGKTSDTKDTTELAVFTTSAVQAGTSAEQILQVGYKIRLKNVQYEIINALIIIKI